MLGHSFIMFKYFKETLERFFISFKGSGITLADDSGQVIAIQAN